MPICEHSDAELIGSTLWDIRNAGIGANLHDHLFKCPECKGYVLVMVFDDSANYETYKYSSIKELEEDFPVKVTIW